MAAVVSSGSVFPPEIESIVSEVEAFIEEYLKNHKVLTEYIEDSPLVTIKYLITHHPLSMSTISMVPTWYGKGPDRKESPKDCIENLKLLKHKFDELEKRIRKIIDSIKKTKQVSELVQIQKFCKFLPKDEVSLFVLAVMPLIINGSFEYILKLLGGISLGVERSSYEDFTEAIGNFNEFQENSDDEELEKEGEEEDVKEEDERTFPNPQLQTEEDITEDIKKAIGLNDLIDILKGKPVDISALYSINDCGDAAEIVTKYLECSTKSIE